MLNYLGGGEGGACRLSVLLSGRMAKRLFYVLLINTVKTMKNVLVVIKVHFIGMCVVFGEFKLLRDYATFIFTFISRFLLGLNKHFDCLNNLWIDFSHPPPQFKQHYQSFRVWVVSTVRFGLWAWADKTGFGYGMDCRFEFYCVGG